MPFIHICHSCLRLLSIALLATLSISCAGLRHPAKPVQAPHRLKASVAPAKSPPLDGFIQEEITASDRFFANDQILVQKLAEEISEKSPISREQPIAIGDCTYFSKMDSPEAGLKILRRCRNELQPQTVLDLSLISPQASTKIQLGSFALNPSQTVAVFSMQIADAATRFGLVCTLGEFNPERPAQCVQGFQLHQLDSPFAFANDQVLFFSDGPAAWPTDIYKVDIATPEAKELVYHESKAGRALSLRRSDSGAFLFLETKGADGYQLKLLDLKTSLFKWMPVKLTESQKHILLSDNGTNLLVGDDAGISLVSPDGTTKSSLTQFQPGTALRELKAFKNFYAIHTFIQQHSIVSICQYKDSSCVPAKIPSGPSAIKFTANKNFESNLLNFSVSSPIIPPARLQIDEQNRQIHVVDQDIVLDLNASNFVTETVLVLGLKGVEVPLTLFYKKSTSKPAPTVLHVYGAYGEPTHLDYDPINLALMERGFIIAFAHVRGGGELGQAWHSQAQAKLKTNSFEDFEACADYLVSHGYTTNDRMAAYGRSAGGLVVAVEANRNPKLFGSVVAEYPLLDLLPPKTEEPDGPLPLDYSEFGDRARPSEREFMASYSPYQNLKAQSYPALLISAGTNDPLIPLNQVARYVKRLRSLKQDQNPLILLVNNTGEHKGPQSKEEAILSAAQTAAFLKMTVAR